MPQITNSDAEQIVQLAEVLDLTHDRVREIIQQLHSARANLSAAKHTLNGIIERARARGESILGSRGQLPLDQGDEQH